VQLTYATSSPIPLYLTFASTDAQALDLLASPRAPNLVIVRTLAIGSNATNVSAPRRSNNTFLEECGKAYWWPAEESPAEVAARGEKGLGWEDEGNDGEESIAGRKTGKRILMGELEVRKGLRPTFSFPKYCVWVSRYHLTPPILLS
jgi:hypothetical protein